MATERALHFACEGDPLLGVLHVPKEPARDGVVIVVGGPQYRVGSHRLFVLLARHLAERGIAVFRFDHRGIGDSGGTARTFLATQGDIRSAVDVFCGELPGLTNVYLWGLCDAASAAMMYCHRDPRLKGVVVLNPWVRTEDGLARTYLSGYYSRRLRSADFWRRLIRGQVPLGASLRSLFDNVRKSGAWRTKNHLPGGVGEYNKNWTPGSEQTFPALMLEGLKRFQGRVLIILSGDDLTADEFRNLVARSRNWRTALGQENVSLRDLPEANHTFAQRIWRDKVALWTAQWVTAK